MIWHPRSGIWHHPPQFQFHTGSIEATLRRVIPYTMYKTPVRMEDGRTLNYYDFAAQGETPPFLAQHESAAQEQPPTGPRILQVPPEMRWNPTLGEWSVYSPGRMTRANLPSPDACPLCPGILELPLNYQVAIFENKSPAMAFVPGDTQVPDVATQKVFELTVPARGRCDLVVYSQNHGAKFASMPVNEIACLMEAWRDRYQSLTALPEIKCVTIFENKGREAGMTLDHPHGQIYGFPFLPPLVLKQWEQTQALGGELWDKVIEQEQHDKIRVLAETDGFLVAQPNYARYPYETHIWAKRAGVSSLLAMTASERAELSALMKQTTVRYENLHASWPNAKFDFPTLMVMQQLTNVPGAERFRFHVEFYPLQRAPDKLKYRASIETGTGAFLNDAVPETQAAQLREVNPALELPSISFH